MTRTSARGFPDGEGPTTRRRRQRNHPSRTDKWKSRDPQPVGEPARQNLQVFEPVRRMSAHFQVARDTLGRW